MNTIMRRRKKAREINYKEHIKEIGYEDCKRMVPASSLLKSFDAATRKSLWFSMPMLGKNMCQIIAAVVTLFPAYIITTTTIIIIIIIWQSRLI
jgi:hypothetical protein